MPKPAEQAQAAATVAPSPAEPPKPAPAPKEAAEAHAPQAEKPAAATAPETKPAAAAPATPPVVEQPATAAEPAHPVDVPKPEPKPQVPSTASDKTDAAATEQNPPKDKATADEKPTPDAGKPDTAKADDGKPETEKQDGEKADASPPPPPLVKEDPEELKACLADLAAIGAKFEPTDPIDDGNGCGIEHPVDVAEVLPGVNLGGATMRCKTALTMAHWLKDTVQPAMNIAMPGRRIVGLVPGSTYQCRLRNNASTGKISEHARGNAYDVAAFKLDNGEKIEMTPRTDDSTMEGAFQRTATAGACLHFTTVLSPGSDAAHETHLHLDILERKGGYRYCR
jgi:hypothetical protein